MKVNYYQGHGGPYELRQNIENSRETNSKSSKWNLVNVQTDKTIAQSLNAFLVGSCPENRTKRYVKILYSYKHKTILN